MNRTRVWLVVSPVVAGGLLVAHSLAYRLTATATDPFHSYLEHVPQILLLLVLAGLVLARVGSRLDAPLPAAFPLVALTTFVLQEHVERIVHGGGVPFLLTTPAFLVGLLLQVPFALVAFALARWLLAAVREESARQPTGRRLVLFLVRSLADVDARSTTELRLPPGRGPPGLLASS